MNNYYVILPGKISPQLNKMLEAVLIGKDYVIHNGQTQPA